jgi:hypothetical protein
MNNADEAPENMEPDRSSRRQSMIRLGLMLYFILIFMNESQTKVYHKEEIIAQNEPRSIYVNRLNEVINSQRHLYIENAYARNITGVFHGSWESGTVTTSTTSSIKDVQRQPGTFVMQLRSIKLANVPDMDFVYGVAKLYKMGSKETDLMYPLQG